MRENPNLTISEPSTEDMNALLEAVLDMRKWQRHAHSLRSNVLATIGEIKQADITRQLKELAVDETLDLRFRKKVVREG